MIPLPGLFGVESAVLKFVEQNPGTDAEIVAVRVGLPKGKAQDVLDYVAAELARLIPP
jgi:hypothetical protein